MVCQSFFHFCSVLDTHLYISHALLNSYDTSHMYSSFIIIGIIIPLPSSLLSSLKFERLRSGIGYSALSGTSNLNNQKFKNSKEIY